jgi:manganese oxidase
VKIGAGVAAIAAACAILAAVPAAAHTRTYFVAADDILWRYAPSGTDALRRQPFPTLPFRLGYTYHKVMYRQYTDGTFSQLVPRDPYLGLMGPVLHAEVGDTIVIHFKNRSHISADMEPIGPVTAAAAKPIPPGWSATYRWEIGDDAGPGPDDPSSTLWLYWSNGADPGPSDMTGLQGPVVVTRAGAARDDGSPADVDREVFAWFEDFDETVSVLWSENLADTRTNPHHYNGALAKFAPYNIFSVINGYGGGSMPMITLRRGQRVRWYVFDGGSSSDGHIPTWTGNTVLWQGHRVDAVTLNFTQPVVADMSPDAIGTWMLYCTLNIHLENGMDARYRVVP